MPNPLSQNASLDEVAKFNDPKQDWWNIAGPFKALHHLNPARIDFMTQHVDLRNKRILDVGCGGGILTEALTAYEPRSLLGIDLAEHAIMQATAHAQQLETKRKARLKYQVKNIAELVSVGHTYDVITCMELLEHVPDPNIMITQLAALLAPGGHLFLSTLNRTPKAFFLGIVAAEYLLDLVPKGSHHYDKFIKPEECRKMLRNNGLQLQALSGVHYSPWNASARLQEGTDINYLVYATKVNT